MEPTNCTMETTYRERIRHEYAELKDKYDKLHKMLVKHDAGTLGFEFNCPVDLLRRQAAAMGEYLYVLEIRAEIENVSI